MQENHDFEYRSAEKLSLIVTSLLNMFAAIAAFMVVKGITARQTERFAKLGSYSSFYSEPPPPPSFT